MTKINQSLADPRLAGDLMRAGDKDREHVAERLRIGHAEGRLDSDELADRIGRCYEARTFGELRRLTADLQSPERGDRRLEPWRRGRGRGRVVLVAIAALWVLAAAAHGHAPFAAFWLVLVFAFLVSRLVRAVRF